MTTSIDTTTEFCSPCGMDTQHSVTIELWEERNGGPRARMPYRVTTCSRCGHRSSERANGRWQT